MKGFCQDWEFAHWFFKQVACFLWGKERFAFEKEQIAPITLLSWATWKNCPRRSFVTSHLSKSLTVTLLERVTGANPSSPSLKKSKSGKEWQERFTLRHKKGEKSPKNCQKHTKNMNFLSKSQAKHSHCSFFKERQERCVHITLL